MTLPPVAPEIIQAALLTYDLEQAMSDSGLQRDALAAALAAGIRANERQVVSRLARQAETYASEMEANDDGEDPFAVALHWFADLIRKQLKMDDQPGEYRPVSGDVVEVAVVGQVTTWHEVCAHCNKEAERHNSWSVKDDRTGLEFAFPSHASPDHKPQVRVLARAQEGKE